MQTALKQLLWNAHYWYMIAPVRKTCSISTEQVTTVAARQDVTLTACSTCRPGRFIRPLSPQPSEPSLRQLRLTKPRLLTNRARKTRSQLVAIPLSHALNMQTAPQNVFLIAAKNSRLLICFLATNIRKRNMKKHGKRFSLISSMTLLQVLTLESQENLQWAISRRL